jgi:prolyl 4-hydroxylase
MYILLNHINSCCLTDHGEGLQVLHYEVGQKYEPHFDYFLDEFNTKNGGQRMATLLMYL